MKTLKYFLVLGILITMVGSDVSSALARSELRAPREPREGNVKMLVDSRVRGEIRQPRVVNDEIVVKFASSSEPTRVSLGGRNVDESLAEYRSRPDIEYAEPNYIAEAFILPNDPLYQYQWNFDNAINGGVHAQTAWNESAGSGVVVAVIDTGVAYENYQSGLFSTRYYQAPDLAGTTFVPGYDYVNNDTHPNDDNGHGTHVAGTISGATNNGQGVSGLAYQAKIMPLKVLDKNGSGNYLNVANAIRFAADNGAKVINLSLGGPTGATYLEEALAYAHGKGVTIVAASGNNGSGSVSYPAAYDKYVIAVGATRFDETKSSYSNYGSALDIVAPGGDTSVDQNGDGQPDGILQQTFSGGLNNFNYFYYQGTSMATPHVAAAAAMLIENGAGSPSAVRQILEGSADDLGPSGRDNTYGFGLLNLASALGVTVAPPPVVVDEAPTISLTAPTASSTVSGTVLIKATALDDKGITKVDFKINGQLLASDNTSPYEVSFNTTTVTNGVKQITAIAYDTAGKAATTSRTVLVNNPILPSELVIFSDSFENNFNQWTQDSQKDWDISNQRATAGSRSAEVDGSAVNASITTSALALQGKSNARINFSWLIEDSVDKDEYLAFDVSTDGGLTWNERGRLRGNVDPENVWQSTSINLTNINQLRLRFRGLMSGSTEDANTDNVTVTAY
jgi:serine protease